MTSTQVAPPASGSAARTTQPNVPTTVGPPAPVGRLAASAALAVFTLCSADGLVRVFNDDGWIAPVVVTVLAVSVVSWALRALRIPGSVAAPLVGAVGLLSVSWTVLGRYTFYGLPSPGTWDHATSAMNSVGKDIATMVAPVKLTTGFEVLAVSLAAVAAALGDWIAFRARIALAGLAPGLAVFVFCCAVGAPTHRPEVIGLAVGGASVYLLIERATSPGQLDWFAGIRPTVNVGLMVGGGILAAIAVLAALALSPALAPRDGAGVLGFRNGTGPGGGERIVPNPLVDLQTRLTQLGNDPVFLAKSSQPSYWRLTSLDSFNGQTWTSTGSYRGFDTKLPGDVPATSGARTVKAGFTIQQLDSPWLPAQFTPVAERGGNQVTYDAASNSLLTASNTSNKLTYTVTSVEYLDALTAAQLSSAPPIDPNGPAAGDVRLPADLDPQVAALAVTITSDSNTEYAKAVALQSYLRGPSFRYTLTPALDGSGANALTTFLFRTRQGYCQQFAGAYAVLARAIGLPTRLAIGFVTGSPRANSQYQVYDRDAHTWPEVYFGPKYGWVPFEPTKGFSIPGTAGYAQITDAGSGADGPGSVPPTTTVPTTAAPSSGTTTPITRRLNTPSTVASGVAPTPPSGPTWWEQLLRILAIPVSVVVIWVLACGLVPVATRERRRRKAAAAGTAAVVAQEWDEVARELIRYGLRRSPFETDDEYARRAEVGLARVAVVPERATWQHGGLSGLAALSRRATFAAEVPADVAVSASVAAAEIRARLAASLTLKERIMRWTAPSPGALRSMFGRLKA